MSWPRFTGVSGPIDCVWKVLKRYPLSIPNPLEYRVTSIMCEFLITPWFFIYFCISLLQVIHVLFYSWRTEHLKSVSQLRAYFPVVVSQDRVGNPTPFCGYLRSYTYKTHLWPAFPSRKDPHFYFFYLGVRNFQNCF